MDVLNLIGDFFKNLIDCVLDWVVELLNWIFGGLGELIAWWFESIGLDISIPVDVFNVFNDITYSIGYIFPIKELLPIPIFMFTFYVARIVFAVFQIIASTVIKRVKVKV